ncbi:MAG: ATP-dependent Clp protease proteolytic subunit [Patescibacteria group bacterium]
MEKKLGGAIITEISGVMDGKCSFASAWREGVRLPIRDAFDLKASTLEVKIEALRQTPDEYAIDAHFLINNSPGGDGEEVRRWKQYMSAIRSTGGRVSTQILGYAGSAAAWTFMLGDTGHRFMTSDGKLGLHNATLEIGATAQKSSDPLELIALARRDIAKLIEISGEMREDTEFFLQTLPSQERQRIMQDAFSRAGDDFLTLRGSELERAGVTILTADQIVERVVSQFLRLKN